MSAAETITIAMTPDMAGDVRRAVAAGEYSSVDDAIRGAIREWQERRDLLGYTVEELGTLALDGLSSGPSRLASMGEVKAEARRRRTAVAG